MRDAQAPGRHPQCNRPACDCDWLGGQCRQADAATPPDAQATGSRAAIEALTEVRDCTATGTVERFEWEWRAPDGNVERREFTETMNPPDKGGWFLIMRGARGS